MNKYVSRALKVLKTEGAENVGNILRGGGLVIGGALGGVVLGYTNDAVSATHAMQPGAIAYLAGEGLLVAREYAIGGVKNAIQHVGRLVRIVSPVVMSVALGDTSYNPALDLGPVITGGTGLIATYYGDRKQERNDGSEILQKNREAAIDMIKKLPEKDLASAVGKAAKINKSR